MVQQQPGTRVVVKSTGEIIESKEAPLVTLSEVSIANIAHNVAMSEKLVTTLLEREIDYGRTPGTQSDGLWDAGAAKIMAGFNCYVDHQVLFHTDEEKLISWCIQANIISRKTQTIVGTGVGAASTKETKYKYRWVIDPQNYGYGDDEIAKMKTRDEGRKYRIENPEYGELVNTLFLMAAKRAEVDGARSMPGVGSALKKLFDKKIKSQPQTRENPWSQFWGKVAQLGLTQNEARELLGVKSMKEWTDSGGTIKSAITELAAAIARGKTGQEQTSPPREARVIPERTEDEFKSTMDLLRICSADFNGMTSTNVFLELGYPNQSIFEESLTGRPIERPLFQAYLQIKATKTERPPEEKVEEKEDFPF